MTDALICQINIRLYLFFFGYRYVHNNIFFSFAVDADLEQLSKKRSLNANSNIENSSLSNSSSDKAFSLLHVDSGIPSGEKCEPKITGEGDNVVEVPSNVSAETQLTESEQATYASANNDLKGTKAYQEADVSGLYNLAMAIIDYRGHRVVAQVCIKDIFLKFFIVKLHMHPMALKLMISQSN